MDNKRIICKVVGGSIRIIPVQEVVAIRSNVHVQEMFLRNGESLTLRQTMRELREKLEELSPGQFMSPIKGALVNALDVESVTMECVTVQQGMSFPIADRAYRKFAGKVVAYLTAHDENVL